MSVLPMEMGVSWEYHLSGAVFGVISGFVWRRADPAPPRRRYSWEIEEESPPETTLELPSPNDVPVIWHRTPDRQPTETGVVLPFRRPPAE